jgi:hypothetical protein
MKRFLLFIIPTLFLGCADSDAPSVNETPANVTESPAISHPDDLVGIWALVDQRGYSSDHPRDVQQVLTFSDGGRMTNLQSTGGQSLAMVLTYQVEGDEILASVESAEMNGEPFDLGETAPRQTYRWRIESGRLILEGSEPGTHDVFRRAD